jgi:serine protease
MSIRNLALLLLLVTFSVAKSERIDYPLHREVVPRPTYTTLPSHLNTQEIVVKFNQNFARPEFQGRSFLSTDSNWIAFNHISETVAPVATIDRYISIGEKELRKLTATASKQLGPNTPDLTAYYTIRIDSAAPPTARLALLYSLNNLDVVELAYFPSVPTLAGTFEVATPNFQGSQFYLNTAPEGIDAYYAWGFAGGKGENVKVIDIEGNWVEHHEDIRGGTSSFHIAGGKIENPTWYHHGTAVLGEIASDSNLFGTTGIAYNVNLGTVSIGSLPVATAIAIAAANSDTGDVILIELQVGGPLGGTNYLPVEWEQATFDAILLATASGRIIVEAGANGGQDLDNTSLHGQLFNPAFRFSGAILVGAANPLHVPEGFSNYGQRVDVHAFGEQVYTLGYGDLYGTDTLNYYTGSFSGTSSASPIVTGACAVLQGIHKNLYQKVLDHNAMRALLINHGTAQFPSVRHIGPMPNLKGAVDEVVGVSFAADTTVGWVPFSVAFSGNSGLPVDTWRWNFGDGDSALLQNPTHVFDSAGVFDVQLQITAGTDIRTSTRLDYVIALADTLGASGSAGGPGDTVTITISATNTIPLRTIILPVEYTGSLHASIAGFSTAGCRTDYFQVKSLIGWDTADFTYRLRSSSNGTAPDLPPGSGPIFKIQFVIPETAMATDTQFLSLDGYTVFTPNFSGLLAQYPPRSTSGLITVCSVRGDVNQSGTINVVDLSYLVQFLFQGGPSPVPLTSGDVNCSGGTNVVDLVYLVNRLFSGGPPPCGSC